MFEILRIVLPKIESNLIVYFDFVYDGLVVKGASLVLNENNEIQVELPKRKNFSKNDELVCYFGNSVNGNMEALMYLVMKEYNHIMNNSLSL